MIIEDDIVGLEGDICFFHFENIVKNFDQIHRKKLLPQVITSLADHRTDLKAFILLIRASFPD